MKEMTVNLYECRHCDGLGTCKSGENGASCLACYKKNELPFLSRKNQFGLLCGSCGGIGKAEPLTERMHNRIAPMLAVIMVFSLLVIISVAAFNESPFFSELLAFSSAIIGSVIGFYFSSTGK